MAETREPSHPPSEPQPALLRNDGGGVDGRDPSDRPVRIQLFVALLLGLVLVATGLYLWRRPRAAPEASALENAADSGVSSAILALADGGVVSAVAQVEAGTSSGVSVSDPRVVSCHDKGTKKTAPADCDHLGDLEQALVRAVEQSATCVPEAAGGGTIEYLADVSFARKKNAVSVTLPKDNRSMKNTKALVACKGAVAHALRDVAVDGVTHAHQRYKISITATYPGPVKAH
jgi:hypothetical protein